MQQYFVKKNILSKRKIILELYSHGSINAGTF